MIDWVFRTESGQTIDPNGLIFPLTSHKTPGTPFRVIGTAFMVAKPAIFLTARHCLYRDKENTVPYDGKNLFGIVHHALPVQWSVVVDGTDVAIGQLDAQNFACDECLSHKVMVPCTWTPIEKEVICHWGCDLTEIQVIERDGDDYHLAGQMKVRGYNGHFIEKLDKYPPFTQTQCYVTSATIPHGASGGPVTLSTGHVAGITTSSSDLGGYSIASLVQSAIDAQIPPNFRLSGETKGRKQTFSEMLSEFGVKIYRGA